MLFGREYRKYRFYFEDYTNQHDAFRVWWSTEATNNEYLLCTKFVYNPFCLSLIH
jgi:hypothetical protein